MKETPFPVKNRRGEQLSAVLTGDLGDAVVVSCHGMLSTKSGNKHLLLAQELLERGTSCLRFDFAGRGDSEGSLFDMSYSNQMEDLLAVLDALGNRGVNKVALFGSSMGGAVALLGAARDERVVAVATLAAVGHPEEVEERHPDAVAAWLEHGFVETEGGKIGRGFYDDALTHDVLAAVRILSAELLIVHGEEDEIVPSSDGHDIASTAKNARLEMVAGADHRFSDPTHLRPAMRQIAEFLASALR